MSKKISFNIRKKLLLTFLIMIILLGLNAFFSIGLNRNAKKIGDEINQTYKPLLNKTKALDNTQKSSVLATKHWINNRRIEDKAPIKHLVLNQYPKDRLELGNTITTLNNQLLSDNIRKAINKCDIIVKYQKELMELLSSHGDYENYERISYCQDLFNKNIEPVSKTVSEELSLINLELDTEIRKLEEVIFKKNFQFKLLTYIVSGLLFLIIILLVYYLPISIVKRITTSSDELNTLIAGHTLNIKAESANDELGMLESSIESLNTKLEGIKTFAERMGKGDFNTDIEEVKNWGAIGSAMEEMKKSLQEIATSQEKQRKEEELNAWISNGVAHFNEILRLKNNDIEELSYAIIKELVKYINAIVGGIYISKTDDRNNTVLELSSLFAYDRKRYIETKVSPGEGLIGTAFVEQHKIYMREIPEDYLKISSGLGESSPNELLIVPLLYQERIHGVMEIATLGTFEPHVIEFVERIAEGLASTISSVIINSETARLLAESNEKAEKLHSQEEELRQNMEELHASQEERERQASHLASSQKNLEEIIMNLPVPVFVKDAKGNYIMINTEQEKLIGKTNEEMAGKDDSVVISDEEILNDIKKMDLDIIKNKKKIELEEQEITFNNGIKRKIKTTKIPILNNVTCEINILGISYIQ